MRFHLVRQRNPPVLLEKKSCVGKARGDDPLVAFPDASRGRIVRDDEEMRHERSGDVPHRKVLLVHLHLLDEDYIGDREEFLLEAAGHDIGTFREEGHRIDEFIIGHECSPELPGGLYELGADEILSLSMIEEYAAVA